MIEVEAVANKLEIELPVSIDQRIPGAKKMGEYRQAGRSMEFDAIAGAVVELGRRLEPLLGVMARGGIK